MKLYLVIPCFNEQEALPVTAEILKEKLVSLIGKEKISSDSAIVFVDDGSTDKTWEIIENLNAQNQIFKGIKLSANKGHQNALMAGLMTVREECDAVISLDADLQDDVNAIDEMTDKYLEGFDIVCGVRSDRTEDSFIKRQTAQTFYKILSRSGVKSVYNHADYRLMSRRALEALSHYGESNLYLRGIVPQLGFKTSVVYYERKKRIAGKSKYTLSKMFSLASEAIFSLTAKPVKLIFMLSALAAVFSVPALIKFFISSENIGRTDFLVLFAVLLSAAAILFSLGILGEYAGRIYFETKNRPRYFVEKYIR